MYRFLSFGLESEYAFELFNRLTASGAEMVQEGRSRCEVSRVFVEYSACSQVRCARAITRIVARGMGSME